MLKFKLVDYSDQIRQAASAWTGVSGQGAMHIAFTKEGDPPATKVVVVPIQGAYDATWGPCPAELRAENYHDPVAPGSVIKGDDGVGEYVWVKEQGYVEATADNQSTASKAHTLAALAAAAEAYAKAS